MPTLIAKPTSVKAAGNKVKLIEEYVGLVNTGDSRLSIALMNSPAGWQEPGQTPAFDELSVVLEGSLVAEHKSGKFVATAGQAVFAKAGEWVRYQTPHGAKYLSVCLPAFSPQTVHRDA
jgi:ethanolamine utilization protein EutQ (cupin superfamily)